MRSALGVLAAAAAMALCCAGPALVAVGGLGLFGALLANPYLIGAALLTLAAAAAWTLWHRRTRREDTDCCPPRPAQPRKESRQ